MSLGLIVTDLERFIMKYMLLLLVMFSVACSETGSGKEDQKYELVCKHPLGHVVRYPVSFDTLWSPHNMRGGIFRFRTLDGKIVRSSFCHGEAVH